MRYVSRYVPESIRLITYDCESKSFALSTLPYSITSIAGFPHFDFNKSEFMNITPSWQPDETHIALSPSNQSNGKHKRCSMLYALCIREIWMKLCDAMKIMANQRLYYVNDTMSLRTGPGY